MGFADFLSLIDMAVPTIYTVGAASSVKVSSYACLVNNAVYYVEEPPTMTGVLSICANVTLSDFPTSH